MWRQGGGYREDSWLERQGVDERGGGWAVLQEGRTKMPSERIYLKAGQGREQRKGKRFENPNQPANTESLTTSSQPKQRKVM